MSDAARRFFSADSLERAVLEAASHFGIAPEALRYRQVEKRGATKRRKVVIRVDPEAPAGGGPLEPEPEPETVAASADADPGSPARDEEEALPEPPVRRLAGGGGDMEIRLPTDAQEWFDLLPEADVEERVVAERWCSALLELAELDLTARVRQGEEGLEVNLTGPDAEWLSEDDGEVLAALQHLLPRLMQSDLERLVSCRVDSGGFQLLREERLRARAHWAAEEVRSEGRAVTLEPMAPADRRIIHLALVNDATVDTESLGRGYFKRVSVRPA
ncbi:MAG TPA: R3H domain-containing nucleic acid-binding protein [Thermoanaerobaculia bacterium]|nr:R3H domain-containing nucleic acid-binding protein [Thermoanaerobaculia bacterium]